MKKKQPKKFVVKINAPYDLSLEWMSTAKKKGLTRSKYLLNLIQSSSESESSEKEKEKEFEEFWSLYPLKKAKNNARKSFLRLTKKDKFAIKESLPIHLEYWNGISKQFIPHASTWLNNRRWEDEIDTSEDTFLYKKSKAIKIYSQPKQKQLNLFQKVLQKIKN